MKVIRPRFLIYVVAGTAVVNVVSVGSALFTGTFQKAEGGLLLLAAADALVWTVFVQPKIAYDETKVVVANPFRTLSASWSAVTGLETRYGLAIKGKTSKFVAWSASAPSRREAGRVRAADLKGTALHGSQVIEPGQLETSDSGSAYRELTEAKAANTGTAEHWKTSLNISGVLGLAFAVVLGYLALHF